MTKRKRSGGGPTAAIGGMLAGFDHQIFRTTPPPHELVLKARPVRGLSGEPGELGELEITFPEEGPQEPGAAAPAGEAEALAREAELPSGD
jgi:hypothetical protein